jgi:hypothetical protein
MHMNNYKVVGMKIGIVPKYNAIVEKEYCCVPAVLQMIQERRGLRLFTQDIIGHHLGLVVPPERAHLYRIVRTGQKPETGWGTQIRENEYSLNSYFSKVDLPLRVDIHHARDVRDACSFIAENLTRDNDVAVCFNSRSLFGEGSTEHVALIQELEPEGDEVKLIDPAVGMPKERKVRLTRLLQILEKAEPGGLQGFWVFSEV